MSWVWYSLIAPRMWGLTKSALKREKIRNISLAFLAVPSWSLNLAVILVSTRSILSSYLCNAELSCKFKTDLNNYHWSDSQKFTQSLSPYTCTGDSWWFELWPLEILEFSKWSPTSDFFFLYSVHVIKQIYSLLLKLSVSWISWSFKLNPGSLSTQYYFIIFPSWKPEVPVVYSSWQSSR